MKRYYKTPSGDIKGFSSNDISWLGFEIGYEEDYNPHLNMLKINYYSK